MSSIPCAQADAKQMQTWLESEYNTESVANFKAGPGVQKLQLKFDIDKLRQCYKDIQDQLEDMGSGFHVMALTRRPGVEQPTAHDNCGRFWTRVDDSYAEVPRDIMVDESAYSEFNPLFAGTYLAEVYEQLIARFPIGRMRILGKDPYNCNSWHRDPEPRLHIPIITNPGALFIVNHHCTHLPADGSVYFTDTRGYHTALNGGEDSRVHIVAALPYAGHQVSDVNPSAKS